MASYSFVHVNLLFIGIVKDWMLVSPKIPILNLLLYLETEPMKR